MKLLKFGLRFWITLTSVFSFLVGWVMLAHAPKPVQAAQATTTTQSIVVTPLPTLAPLNFSNGNNGGIQVQQFNVQPQQPSIFTQQQPVFSTGGS